MPRQPGSKSPEPPVDNDDALGSRAYPFDAASSTHFKSEMKALGVPKAQRVTAKLRQFENDWRENRPFAFLSSRYKIKHVNKPKSIAPLNVMQIRPIDQVRVYFTCVHEVRTHYYLGAIFKSPQKQQQEIESVAQRARTIREENNGSR